MKKAWGIVNAEIITMDPRRPRASGLVVAGNRVELVGTSAQTREMLGPDCRIIDACHKTVIPGFIDSHTHMIGTGIEKRLRLDLSKCTSKSDLLECVRQEIGRRLVIGVGWDQSCWPGVRCNPATVFNREELDRLSPDQPLVLRRICGHIAFANTKALAMIGTAWSKIDRKRGLLLEDVVSKINRIFPPRDDEMVDAIGYAVGLGLRLGITSVHEMVDRFYFEHLMRYFRLNPKRKLRFYTSFDIEDFDYLQRLHTDGSLDNEFVKLGGVKLYADGSIGARTAALHKGYRGNRANRGLLLQDERRLVGILKRAEAGGNQVLIHTIGDRATSQVLKAFAQAGTGKNRLRHRIEHVEIMTRASDFDLVSKLNLIVSLQPNFIGNWGQPGGMYEMYLGKKRWQQTNRLRTFQKLGLTILFGSDCMPPGPVYGIHWAVNHPVKAERLSVEAAIRSYTQNGAYGSFEEDIKGSLAAGKVADFVVLSLKIDCGNAVSSTEVFMTVFDGKVAYRK